MGNSAPRGCTKDEGNLVTLRQFTQGYILYDTKYLSANHVTFLGLIWGDENFGGLGLLPPSGDQFQLIWNPS